MSFSPYSTSPVGCPQNHRRISSASDSTISSDSSFVYHRCSIIDALQDAEDNIEHARTLAANMDAALMDNITRALVLEKALDQACQQLDDHRVYFEGRYKSKNSPHTDLWLRNRELEELWKAHRKQNATVTRPTDNITALPFKNNAHPTKFPRRLAGLMTLSERQTEGFLYGYGQTPPSGSVDAKRRALALFIGIRSNVFRAGAASSSRSQAKA